MRVHVCMCMHVCVTLLPVSRENNSYNKSLYNQRAQNNTVKG